MNDELKIRALMIYFSHWGMEEARIQNNIKGARLFLQLVDKNYTNREDNALGNLTDTNKLTLNFWHGIIDTLLPDMNHWVEYYDYITKPLYYKIKFSEMNGVGFYDIFYSGLDPSQMKALDAIIALPIIK